AAIASLFADSSIPGGVSVSGRRTRLELVSKLSRGESVTIESQALPGAVASADSVYLDAPASPALEVYLQQCVSDGRVLGSIRLPPYTTVSVPPVEGERSRRIAFRVTGACVTYMDALRVSGGRPIAPSLVGSNRLLLVANGYP